MIQYKGYTAKITHDSDDNVLVGEIIDVNDVIAFEGRSIDEMEVRMKEAVDGYLSYCEEEGVEPAKPR
jgi:predicted HicB family RNase H-like nuclease